MATDVTVDSSTGNEQFSPAKLADICLYYCVKNKEKVFIALDEDRSDNVSIVRETFGASSLLLSTHGRARLKKIIPPQILTALLNACGQYLFAEDFLPLLAAIRNDSYLTLAILHLSNATTLTDFDLQFLMSGNSVTTLDIHNCPRLTSNSLGVINGYGSKLESLKIGDSCQILPNAFKWSPNENTAHGILRTPCLKRLTIWGLDCVSEFQVLHPLDFVVAENYWRDLTKEFISNLELLDLTGCACLENLKFLKEALKLRSLALGETRVRFRKLENWNILLSLTQLRFLDISSQSSYGPYSPEPPPDSVTTLESLIWHLPHLTSLDVQSTFTVLPSGPPPVYDKEKTASVRGDTPLQLFCASPLDHGTENIRAKHVVGFDTPQQDFISLQYYSKRKKNFVIMNLIICRFMEYLRTQNEVVEGHDFFTFHAALDLLIDCLRKTLGDPHVFHRTVATIRTLIKTRTPVHLDEIRASLIISCIAKEIEIRYSSDNVRMNPLYLDCENLIAVQELESFGFLRNKRNYETLLPVVCNAGIRLARNVTSQHADNFIDFLWKYEFLLSRAIEFFPSVTFDIGGVLNFLNETWKYSIELMESKLISLIVVEKLFQVLLNFVQKCNPSRKTFVEADGVQFCFGILCRVRKPEASFLLPVIAILNCLFVDHPESVDVEESIKLINVKQISLLMRNLNLRPKEDHYAAVVSFRHFWGAVTGTEYDQGKLYPINQDLT